MSYARKLSETTAQRGNLCVGIDPMPSVLDAWGLMTDVKGLEACARGVVEELGERIAVFKPQSAFFEAFGSPGIAVLERVLEDIREAGAISLLDVKRGDIGSSMTGYAAAYLEDGAPLAADAVTLSPYLGVGALLPAIDLAVAQGRGVYVLARTSNPEGARIQHHAAQVVVDEITGRSVSDTTRSTNAKALLVRGAPLSPPSSPARWASATSRPSLLRVVLVAMIPAAPQSRITARVSVS